MANTHVETTSRGWSARLGVKGIFGIVLFILGTGLLWWIEDYTVNSGGVIAEVRKEVVELGDISKIDPAFNGKLVHATGTAKAVGKVTDSHFGITAQTVVIWRDVEYYQWVHGKKGGPQKKWMSYPVKSFERKGRSYDNTPEKVNGVVPKRPDVRTETFSADAVTFGAYTLSSPLVKRVEDFAYRRNLVINLDDNARRELEKEYGTTSVNRNVLYFGKSPGKPRIGDVRVTYEGIPDNQTISLIAQVNGNSLTPWEASNGESFCRLTFGDASLAQMIQTVEENDSIRVWIFRIPGIFLVIFGLKMVLAPLSIPAGGIPLLGSIVGFGAYLVAGLLGVAWSCSITGLTLISSQPELGACLLGVAALCVALVFLRRKKAAPQAPHQPHRRKGYSKKC